MAVLHQLATGAAALHTDEQRSLPHVLLVVDGFPKTLGGGERIVLRLAALLPQYGFRASILTFALDPQSEFTPAQAPCPLYLLPLRRTYDLQALRGAFAIRKLMKTQQIVVVQTFFESSDLWAGLVTRLFSSAKLIWSRRDLGILRGRKHTAAYRLLRHLPHQVLAVSEQVRRHVIEVDRIAPARVLTVYNGVDVEAAPEALGAMRDTPNAMRDHPDQASVVLTIGNIRRVKGHDILVQAAAVVLEKFPRIRFDIAGDVLDEVYFQQLQAQIQHLGIGASVHFLGGVRDLAARLRTADIFVLPSRSEGFSNALVEAMAYGLPVVATTVGGNAEAVDAGVTGLLVPAEDAGALAHALLTLLTAPARAGQMGDAGRRRWRADFTAAAMMQKTVAAYRAVLDKQRRSLP